MGFWGVYRYRDIVSVLRHPEIFSSEYGNILPTRKVRDSTAGKMTFTSDPPEHTRIRGVIAPALTPRQAETIRPVISRIVEQMAAEVTTGQVVDFMTAVAGRLPISVACALMGVPEADWPMVIELTHLSHGVKDENLIGPTSHKSGSSSANLQLLAYFSELAADRRRHPADDLVSTVARNAADGRPLTDEEIAINCFALTLGGYQADRNAMGAGLLALIENPDQFDLLVSDPSIMPTAVEEILRWSTPTLNLARVALRDTEIAGVPIAAGDRVSAWLISANRDEEIFDDPYRFSLTRHPNRHLSFGNGSHYCVGANVARLEMSLLLESILARRVRPVLAGEPTRIRSYFQQGLKTLPVRFVAR